MSSHTALKEHIQHTSTLCPALPVSWWICWFGCKSKEEPLSHRFWPQSSQIASCCWPERWCLALNSMIISFLRLLKYNLLVFGFFGGFSASVIVVVVGDFRLKIKSWYRRCHSAWRLSPLWLSVYSTSGFCLRPRNPFVVLTFCVVVDMTFYIMTKLFPHHLSCSFFVGVNQCCQIRSKLSSFLFD